MSYMTLMTSTSSYSLSALGLIKSKTWPMNVIQYNIVNSYSQFTLLLHVLATRSNSRDASECSSGVKWFFFTCVKKIWRCFKFGIARIWSSWRMRHWRKRTKKQFTLLRHVSASYRSTARPTNQRRRIIFTNETFYPGTFFRNQTINKMANVEIDDLDLIEKFRAYPCL